MNSRAGARPPALPGAVLVLDADQASALAVVRSLASHGLRVEVASAAKNAIASRSRHAAACWTYPDPLADAPAFVDWLETHLRSHAYDLVVPLTERTVIPLAQERARFAPDLIAVADAGALAQVIDKQQTVALAATLGVKVPLAEPVAGADQAAQAAARIGYPLVVKPARSVGSPGGQRVHLAVTYAFDERELRSQVESALRFGPVLLQEYFSGDGVGIELIADHGEPRYLFQHRRLHEVPLTGGGSSLRVSETPDPVLADAATRLMRALRWHGVAMVEFKRNRSTGDYRLMEINGRFWGSLPLAVAAGANFPVMLHELMTTGRVGTWPPARQGTLARHLARDIDWIERVLRREAPPALVKLPSMADAVRDTLLVLSPRHHFDVQSWRDPWPGLVDAAGILAHHWKRFAGRLAVRRALRREQRRSLAMQAAVRARRPGAVLFLCYGNINRSALAHAHAQRQLGQELHFASAGFHAQAGRPADPVMQEVAARHGVSLAGWQSQTLSAAMVEQADLILAMEVSHLDRLEQAFPGSRKKACLLDAGGESAEIPDPFGQARPVYEQVARRVLTAVDRWLPPAPAVSADTRVAPTTDRTA